MDVIEVVTWVMAVGVICVVAVILPLLFLHPGSHARPTIKPYPEPEKCRCSQRGDPIEIYAHDTLDGTSYVCRVVCSTCWGVATNKTVKPEPIPAGGGMTRFPRPEPVPTEPCTFGLKPKVYDTVCEKPGCMSTACIAHSPAWRMTAAETASLRINAEKIH